jgi:hypothetical protein
MKQKQKQDSIVEWSSYSRTILADLKSLSTLIRKYSATQQDDLKVKTKRLTPLKLEQIQNALLNPQNALKPSMAAFATLLRIELNIIKAQEDIQAQRESMRETIGRLREQHIISQDPQEKEKLITSSKNLEDLLQKTAVIYQSLSTSQTALQAHYQKIDALAIKHDQEWHEYRNFYLEETFKNLAATDLELSSTDKDALLAEDTWPQLIQDFKTLNIDIPKELNVLSPNFTTYFKLKAYLIVHNSLSRRMLPHKPSDVLKYVKQVLRK